MIPNINDLSIEQKAGQMCMFGFHGKELSADLLKLIKDRHLGNVIVFARNFHDAGNLKKLCESLYSGMTVPPLISIDQEGGVVTRITEGATLLPGNMGLAATGDPDYAFKYGAIIGRELRSLGVNLNLAPVLDVNHPDNPGIGVRSFGDDPETVIKFGLEVIRGIQSQYVFATGKHFPGKGAAEVDTHFNFAIIKRSLKELEETDIAPFREAVKAGVDCLMTSHAGFPAFTNSGKSDQKTLLPGTFTPEIMTDYLRDKLKFEGVLISDDLEMGAVTKSIDFEEGIVAAVNAGVDILCICRDVELQNLALDTIINSLEKGVISGDRINESVARILRLKRKLEDNFDKYFDEDIHILYTMHSGDIYDIVRQSISVYDSAKRIPLRINPNDNALLIIPRLVAFSPVEELHPALNEAERMIMRQTLLNHEKLKRISYNLPPDNRDKANILSQAQESDFVILCSHNAHLDEDQSDLLKKVADLGKPMALLMLRNPYDRFLLKDPYTAVAVHVPLKPVIKAGINRLFKGI